jgi:protease-4
MNEIGNGNSPGPESSGQTPPPAPQRENPPAPPLAPPPRPPYAQPYQPQQPRRRSRALPIILTILLLMSGLLNLVLLMVVGLGMSGTETVSFDTATLSEGSADQTIALYRIGGIITEETSNSFAAFVDQVASDSNVKAVVLRVDTPGGAVAPSDQMYQQVLHLRNAGKKVVVSMGGVAASGGYYVSVGADEIYAEPTTITGSIGVIMNWLVVEGTLEKIGVESIVLKSNGASAWKDEISPFSRPDDYQRHHLQAMLDQMQQRFDDVVKTGRGSRLMMRQNKVTVLVDEDGQTAERQITETEPLNGKVYTAQEARDTYGLIDAIGYQDDAVSRAATLANLGSPRVVLYERQLGLMDLLSGPGMSTSVEQEMLERLDTPRVMMLWKVN